MDGPTLALTLVAATLTALAVYAVLAYNRLVALRQRLENAFSQIDVQLVRRHDLIPNLVAAVQGYLTHERELLQEVAQARADASRLLAGWPDHADAEGAGAVGLAESALTAALSRLIGVVEAYPELKAAEQTGRLMEELASTENRVAFARQHFNDSAMLYNSMRESFPTLLVAGSLGFSRAAYLEFADRSIDRPIDVALAPGGGT
ncbi:LemA family protein [Oceanidesulfovibrio marinus]|uniref:LemA family protein n=1 Tax=Oceanidesulfovibrio marinus TaxID=370038 RepID=A0ABX6NK40_9BACT|nr:LemA family protein [Oceanidesulfovibrio marinus]QJT11043.1 LemA family protein [Oceanidesulfovibrio marinus]